jgi:hypothetical protein
MDISDFFAFSTGKYAFIQVSYATVRSSGPWSPFGNAIDLTSTFRPYPRLLLYDFD